MTRLTLAAWALLTVLALAGLYYTKLIREDIAWYGGKSVAEQREKVLERAGTPYKNLDLALDGVGDWPSHQGYAARGDFNKLSYFKYLVIPRLPDGTDSHVIRWTDYSLELTPQHTQASATASGGSWDGAPPSPFAFLLSLVTLFGWAVALRSMWPRWALSLSEGTVLSLTVLTALTLGSRIACASTIPGHLLFLILGVLMLAIPAARKRYGPADATASETESDTAPIPRRHQQLFWIALAVTCGWALVKAVIVVPDDWDAWAIWGAKAKVLALGIGPLTDVKYFGHADYPLLWPSLWAFTGGLSVAGWEEHWARAWGAVLLGLTALEIRQITWRRTGNITVSWIAPMLLLSCPKVLLFASWGYAEPALWLALTCAGGRLIRSQSERRLTHVALAGAFCAAAALTKNEGLLFSLLFWVAFLWHPGKWRAALVFCLPMLCIVGPWQAWKSLSLPEGPRVLAESSFSLSHLQYMFSRCGDAFTSIAANWASLTSWNLALPIALVLTGHALCVGTKDARRFAAIPTCALLALFVVILSSPDPVYWQVGTAWDRLTAQVMPLMALTLSFASYVQRHALAESDMHS